MIVNRRGGVGLAGQTTWGYTQLSSVCKFGREGTSCAQKGLYSVAENMHRNTCCQIHGYYVDLQ